MPYYSAPQDDDSPEYIPAAGYDICAEYGEPLEHSEDTCHEMTMSCNDDIEYGLPDFTDSLAKPNAYSFQALQEEYSSYGPPRLSGYAAPDSGPGDQSLQNFSEEHEEPAPELGSGYQPGSEYENPDPPTDANEPEFESGHGKPTENPDRYGSGHEYADTDAVKYENSDPPTDVTEPELEPGYEYGEPTDNQNQYVNPDNNGGGHEYGNIDTGKYENPDLLGDVNEPIENLYENPEKYGRRHEYGNSDAAEYENPGEYRIADTVEYGNTGNGDAGTAAYGTYEGTGYESRYGNQEEGEVPRRYHE